MSRRIQSLWSAPLFLVLTLGCASPPKAQPPKPKLPAPKIYGPAKACTGNPGPSPFKNSKAMHVLVADFWGNPPAEGPGHNEPNFSHTLVRSARREFRQVRSYMQRHPDPKAPVLGEDALEIEGLGCSLQDASQAAALAKSLNADLIIWGESFCKLDFTVGAGRDKDSYVVCPRVLFLPSRQEPNAYLGEQPSLSELGELKLPAIEDTRPQSLGSMILGALIHQGGYVQHAGNMMRMAQYGPVAGEWGAYGFQLLESLLHAQSGNWQEARQRSEDAKHGTFGKGTLAEGAALQLMGLGSFGSAQSFATPHPFRFLLLNNKATENALALMRNGLAIRSGILGKEHPSLATDYTYMGLALEALGRAPEALENFTLALQLQQKELGAGHPLVARTLMRQSSALAAMGKAAEAVDLLQKALAITEKAYGPEHMDYTRALNDAGVVYRTNKQYEDALKHLERAFALVQKEPARYMANADIVRLNLAYARAEKSGWTPPEKRDRKDEGKRYGAVILECVAGTCGGLEIGDWVQKYQGIQIEYGPDLDGLMRAATPERPIKMVVVRNGKTMELKMRGEDLKLKTK